MNLVTYETLIRYFTMAEMNESIETLVQRLLDYKSHNIELNPETTYPILLQAYLQLGRIDESLAYYREIHPNQTGWTSILSHFVEKGQFLDAVNFFKHYANNFQPYLLSGGFSSFLKDLKSEPQHIESILEFLKVNSICDGAMISQIITMMLEKDFQTAMILLRKYIALGYEPDLFLLLRSVKRAIIFEDLPEAMNILGYFRQSKYVANTPTLQGIFDLCVRKQEPQHLFEAIEYLGSQKVENNQFSLLLFYNQVNENAEILQALINELDSKPVPFIDYVTAQIIRNSLQVGHHNLALRWYSERSLKYNLVPTTVVLNYFHQYHRDHNDSVLEEHWASQLNSYDIKSTTRIFPIELFNIDQAITFIENYLAHNRNELAKNGFSFAQLKLQNQLHAEIQSKLKNSTYYFKNTPKPGDIFNLKLFNNSIVKDSTPVVEEISETVKPTPQNEAEIEEEDLKELDMINTTNPLKDIEVPQEENIIVDSQPTAETVSTTMSTEEGAEETKPTIESTSSEEIKPTIESTKTTTTVPPQHKQSKVFRRSIFTPKIVISPEDTTLQLCIDDRAVEAIIDTLKTAFEKGDLPMGSLLLKAYPLIYQIDPDKYIEFLDSTPAFIRSIVFSNSIFERIGTESLEKLVYLLQKESVTQYSESVLNVMLKQLMDRNLFEESMYLIDCMVRLKMWVNDPLGDYGKKIHDQPIEFLLKHQNTVRRVIRHLLSYENSVAWWVNCQSRINLVQGDLENILLYTKKYGNYHSVRYAVKAMAIKYPLPPFRNLEYWFSLVNTCNLQYGIPMSYFYESICEELFELGYPSVTLKLLDKDPGFINFITPKIFLYLLKSSPDKHQFHLELYGKSKSYLSEYYPESLEILRTSNENSLKSEQLNEEFTQCQTVQEEVKEPIIPMNEQFTEMFYNRILQPLDSLAQWKAIYHPVTTSESNEQQQQKPTTAESDPEFIQEEQNDDDNLTGRLMNDPNYLNIDMTSQEGSLIEKSIRKENEIKFKQQKLQESVSNQ
eukprot:gene6155-7665_t